MNVYILTMSDNYNWEGNTPDTHTVCGVYSSIEVAKSYIPKLLKENYVGNELEIKFEYESTNQIIYRNVYMQYDITFDIEEFKLINNN